MKPGTGQYYLLDGAVVEILEDQTGGCSWSVMTQVIPSGEPRRVNCMEFDPAHTITELEALAWMAE